MDDTKPNPPDTYYGWMLYDHHNNENTPRRGYWIATRLGHRNIVGAWAEDVTRRIHLENARGAA